MHMQINSLDFHGHALNLCAYTCDYSPRTCVGVEEAPEWWVCSGCSHLKKPKYELLNSEDN